jgi:DNA-binding NarL/FixJ family response regulator
LADDHAVVRDGLHLLLAAQPDIEVVGEADNGADAVQAVKRLRPGIAVLDIAMPELNGIEAAEQIHAFDPAIRIIILSMYSTNEHVFRARRAGARGYILKESAATEVIAAVREVRFGRVYLSAKLPTEMAQRFSNVEGAANLRTPLERLSPREREVLQRVAEGQTSAQIGAALHLSPKTIDTYRSRLMSKLEITDLASLVRFAIRHGITSAN